jgi:BlaI family penicillinase repressor
MPANPKAPKKGLSDLEHQLMEILWARGSGTAEQIREDLAPRHVLNNSTIRTVLRRLQAKGYVDHKNSGKALVYSGIEKPRNVAVRAVRQILDRFCDGSLEQLLVGLVEHEVVDRAELQQLAQKLGQNPAVSDPAKKAAAKGEK